jgi:hypothetical protein
MLFCSEVIRALKKEPSVLGREDSRHVEIVSGLNSGESVAT